MLGFQRNDNTAVVRARIVDAASAKAWLASFAVPASRDSLATIAAFLAGLGAAGESADDAALSPEKKCAIADRVRVVVHAVLAQRSRDGEFGALPLADAEIEMLWPAVETAAALRDVYAWLASQLPESPVAVGAGRGVDDDGAARATDPLPASVSATRIDALHRALDVNAQILLLLQRARIAVPSAFWERHCALGQMVREIDCQDAEVADAQRASITRTCRAAFVMPVLLALADPAARTMQEFNVVHTAAQRWAGKVGFRIELGAEPFGHPARPVAHPGPALRLGHYCVRFDSQSLVNTLERRLTALADGKTPRELGLGDTLGVPATRVLLLSLLQCWGPVAPEDIDAPDRPWRNATLDASVLAVVGMPSMTTASRSPGPAAGSATGAYATYDYQRMKDGGITRSREEIARDKIKKMLADAETWSVAAEAPDALRCVRRRVRPRISLNQLVGMKLGAHDGAPFLLGWVDALQQLTSEIPGAPRSTSAHTVRVRLAPGLPQLVRVLAEEVELDCAFLLAPHVPEVKKANGAGYAPLQSGAGLAASLASMPETGWDAVRASPRDYRLVLPLATYRPLRVLRAVMGGSAAMLRLEELLMRGSDFDLVRFTPL